MQLLTASNSLMGIKDATCRYRMAEGNLLPKFNSATRVARSTVAEPVALTTGTPVPGVSAAPSRALPTKSSVGSPPIRTREPISGREFSRVTLRAGACSAFMRVLETVYRFAYWKRRKVQATPAKIKAVRPALQGELSLDKVKVVRNDLSDADLEVVPMASLERPQMPEPVPFTAGGSESTGATWGRLTSRLFGARQTPIG